MTHITLTNIEIEIEGEVTDAGQVIVKKKRGFGGMSAEKRSQIASLGGKAAHQKGTAHQFTPEEAREAGRKGGGRPRQQKGQVSNA